MLTAERAYPTILGHIGHLEEVQLNGNIR